MSELEQNLNREWGYTMKGGIRTLTLVELARNKDPKITGEEIVVIVFHGIQSTMDIFREIEFDELCRKFHFGAPFSYRPSWLVSVSYAIDLEDKFHFADDVDVIAQVKNIVSTYGFDAANLKD